MVRIQVISYNGLPPPHPIAAAFNELGGNIGRADGNALILPDPGRHISRTQASVAFRAGKDYVIRDLGTAIPVYLNGHPVGNGQEASITQGDEIRIGGYIMRVTTEISSVTAVPRNVPPPNEATEVRAAQNRAANSFGDLFATPADCVPSGVIPLDFDPFADITPRQPNSVPPSNPLLPDEFDLMREPSQPEMLVPSALDMLGTSGPDQSIDKLFGLGAGKSSEPFPSGNPLAEPMNQPNAAANADPLVVLGAAASWSRPVGDSTRRDDVPELHGAFRPPQAKPDTVMPVDSPAVPPATEHAKPPLLTSVASRTEAPVIAPPPASPEISGMVLSWEEVERDAGVGEAMTVIVASSKRKRERRQGERRKAESEDAISVAGRHARLAGENVQVASVSMPPPQPAPSSLIAKASPGLETLASRDELLRAFLAGAGVSDLAVPGELTPQMMNMLGRLLRESTQGTLDLLLARALTKREVRAEMTIIEVRENNPLKFSPGVEVALAHLLAPQGRGFMKPLDAVKDAYDDLRAHQFGFMAGMRAALAGVLERFNPACLEQRLTPKTMIDSVLPMNRKAKLWGLFSERYDDISKEAEDDFNALFGKEFLRAYEAQIAKLEQDDKGIKH